MWGGECARASASGSAPAVPPARAASSRVSRVLPSSLQLCVCPDPSAPAGAGSASNSSRDPVPAFGMWWPPDSRPVRPLRAGLLPGSQGGHAVPTPCPEPSHLDPPLRPNHDLGGPERKHSGRGSTVKPTGLLPSWRWASSLLRQAWKWQCRDRPGGRHLRLAGAGSVALSGQLEDRRHVGGQSARPVARPLGWAILAAYLVGLAPAQRCLGAR